MNNQNTKHPHTVFIALSGKKQTGKDTSAHIIRDILNRKDKRVARTAFAEPLKKLCIEILGLSYDGVYGTDAQKNALSHIAWDGFSHEIRTKYAIDFIRCKDGVSDPVPRSGQMTNREVLQVMGTDIFRAILDNVWAKAPFNKKWEDYDVVILTDCRFPNEKLETERAGGFIIRLERDTQFKDNHPSEIALDGVDFENTYVNNGSIKDLEEYLENVLWNHKII